MSESELAYLEIRRLLEEEATEADKSGDEDHDMERFLDLLF